MKRAGARVGVGTRFDYDGEVIEIVEVHTIKGAPGGAHHRPSHTDGASIRPE